MPVFSANKVSKAMLYAKNLAMRYLLFPLLLLFGCSSQATKTRNDMETKNTGQYELATFGQGCFWCAEAIFGEFNGVIKVESGYSGGETLNPTYKEVCTGLTGHAEVVQITYDPSKISYDELLEVFWKTHDPTTLNRQGNDSGTQYRSVIFYHNDRQKALAEKYLSKLNQEMVWAYPIVTEISPSTKFYKAEDYHQEYFANNSQQSYCQYVIVPKLEKFKKIFRDKIKK